MFRFRRDIIVKHSKSDDSNNNNTSNNNHAASTVAMEGNPQDDDVFATTAATTTTAAITTAASTPLNHPETTTQDDDDDGDDEAVMMRMEEVALSSSSRTARATNIPLSIRDARRSLGANDHASTDRDDNQDDDEDDDDDILLKRPLLQSSSPEPPPPTQIITTSSSAATPSAATRQQPTVMRVRKTASKRSRQRRHKGRHLNSSLSSDDDDNDEGGHHHHHNHHQPHHNLAAGNSSNHKKTLRSLFCCSPTCMNIMARLLFWTTMISLVAAVFWYSYELVTMGKEPHLIAWFSAGAFVLLGFPISMWGIITHLANYNQPHVQIYIVRILWMVPIYSIESWLAMRFHKQAIYIETLRDFYESYVLYSFLQFLIQVLGGEEALILMLKDKSPTRGYHMWGLQFCVKPWLMGQPVRKIVYERPNPIVVVGGGGGGDATTKTTFSSHQSRRREIKRIHWKSPFFVKCKFGVLQYVLLKLLSAIAVLLLEFKGWYNEGVFSWKSGYLYICFLTNISQCWALYCLIFFYYATHNELSPIRPVGKFLSVKALVFFTWWQSVIIALLYQWGMIPDFLVNAEKDWTEEAVAKGIQDYLICVEMFVAAIVHSFVFPHTEYSPQAVEARSRALNQTPMKWHKKRLGRNKKYASNYYSWNSRDDISKSSGLGVEMTSLDDSNSLHTAETWEDMAMWQSVQPQVSSPGGMNSHQPTSSGALSNDGMGVVGDPLMLDGSGMSSGQQLDEENNLSMLEEGEENEPDSDGADNDSNDEECDDDSYEETSEAEEEDNLTPIAVYAKKPGFVRAFIDSAIPRDLGDGAVGMLKGDYNVEKKTLLHHATTSDQYDLFSPNRRRPRLIGKMELLGKMQNKPGVD